MFLTDSDVWIISSYRDCNRSSIALLAAEFCKSNLELDRKVLSDIAIHDPEGFTKIVKQVMP